MIKIENLSKKFGTKKVLDSIHLEFEKRKIYGVVGENGAGKTTLFKCISGLETSSGKISSDFISLKNTLGLLLTEPFFFPKITGKEYLQLLTNARQVELQNVHDKNIFDLPLNQYASTYSTGMQKKLALTAILLQKTRFSF
jgi:ABC-2 type transport system ATP-binding protein